MAAGINAAAHNAKANKVLRGAVMMGSKRVSSLNERDQRSPSRVLLGCLDGAVPIA
jgi:hypothetical protein